MTIPKLGDYKEDGGKTVVQEPVVVSSADLGLPNIEKPSILPPIKIKEVDTSLAREKPKSLCRWNKVDTLLVVLIIVGALTTISIYYSLPLRMRPRADRHGPEGESRVPEYVTTECTIEQVETNHQVECCINEDDEWCEASIVGNAQALNGESSSNAAGELPPNAPQLPAHQGGRPPCHSQGRRGRRDAHEETGPTFPCLRVLVRHFIGIYGGAAGGHIGMLHTSFIEVENFPHCLLNACGSDHAENEAAIEEARTFWMGMTTQKITCYVNVNNPDEVLHQNPSWLRLVRSTHVQAIILSIIITKVCFWILVVRHMFNACKAILNKGKTVTPRANDDPAAPYVVAGNGKQDDLAKAKELEALGIQGNVLLVASVPPPYEQDMAAPPPPYDPYMAV